jgi:RNA polymerase sigma-70 factor (ECF subfamily)
LNFSRNDLAHLIKRAQDGDEHAMDELITIHKGLVFTFIYRMINDYEMSHDLTQDTFIRVFMNIKKVKSEQHFRFWILTIARNIARDYFRKIKRQPTVSLEEIKEPIGQSGLENTRRSMIIQEALSRLAEQDRMLITLSYFQELSLYEVAQVLKISEKNIKVSLFRARRRLRKELMKYEHELLSSF